MWPGLKPTPAPYFCVFFDIFPRGYYVTRWASCQVYANLLLHQKFHFWFIGVTLVSGVNFFLFCNFFLPPPIEIYIFVVVLL